MSSTQTLQRTATKDRLPPIKRGRGKLLTANLEHVEETGSQRSQNSARHELPDGFSLIHYIHAKVATMDGKKARFDMEFLKKSLQCLDRRQLNEKEEVFGYTSLSLACSVGHDQVVHLLLESRADAAAKCNLGNTALHLAARGGHASVVQKLMMHGAAVGAQNKEGWTPLIWAAMNGRVAVVDALLEKAQATSVDNQGMTALMWATRHGHVDIMKSILATGPDLNFQDLDGHTVMYHAKQHRAARKMLQQFEELNRRLLTSAKSGDVTEASLALEAGAFVDALDSEGASPLLLAASQRHLPMVKLLARHGADLSLEASRAASPWLRNYEFRTSIQEVLRDAVKSNRLLTHSAKEGDWEGVMQAISLGAWPDLPDESQKTALSWAASHGSVDAVRELLQARASINTRDTCGWTAVHWAAHNNWAQVASVLKFHGADVHAKAYTGDTAVHLAAKSGHCLSLAFLSLAEADLDVQDLDGHSPLQASVISGKIASTRCLLGLRAAPDVRDEGGRSLVALATIYGRHALLESIFAAAKVEKAEKADKADKGDAGGGKTAAEEKGDKRNPRKSHKQSLAVVEAKKDDASEPDPSKAQDAEVKVIKMKIPKEEKAESAKTKSKAEKAEVEEKGPKNVEKEPEKEPEVKAEIDPKESAETPDLQLFRQAEALLKKIPKKLDLSVQKALEEVDNDARTPLALAVRAGHSQVVALLLERKASLDAADCEGNSVLTLAAQCTARSTPGIVESLLGLTADAQAVNNENLRPVDLAKSPVVRDMLRRHMERTAVGRKMQSSQSLPALVKAPGEEGKDLSRWQLRGGRVRLEPLPDLPTDVLEEAIRALVHQRRAPSPDSIEVAVHPITQRNLGYAYVDYEDEGTASLLADAWCDAKKDPFRGTVQVLMEVTAPTKSKSGMGYGLGLA